MTSTATAAPTAGRRAAFRLTGPLAVLISAVVAAVTGLYRLGAQPLSWDESVSANAAHRTLPALWHLLGHTDAPLGLYYFGLNAWVRLLGAAGIEATEGWLRLPSALAAIGAVALTARLGTRVGGPRVGLAAGTLLAVQPLMTFYARDARPYTIAVLLVVLASDLLLDLLDRPGRARTAAYLAVAVVAAYVQLLTVTVLLVHALVALRAGVSRRAVAAVAAAIAVAVAPIAIIGHAQSAEIGWIPAPTAAGVASFAVRVGGGAALFTVLALLCAARIGRIRAWLRRPGGAGSTLVGAWAVLPVLMIGLASFVQPVLVPRYALVAVPGAALAGASLTVRGPRSGRLALAALLLAGAVTTGVQQGQAYKYEDYRAAADAVIDTSRAGDGIVFIPRSWRVGVVPYLHGDGDEGNPPVPRDLVLADPASPLSGDTIGGAEYPAGEIGALIDRSARVYVVGQAGAGWAASADGPKAAALRAGYVVAWRRVFGAVSVTLLVRRAGWPVARRPARAA